jgi:hypothetical protein
MATQARLTSVWHEDQPERQQFEQEFYKRMTTVSKSLCLSKKKNGETCRVMALADGYCFSHSPALAAKRLAARARGGQNSATAIRLEKLVPERLTSVYGALGEALVGVRRGKLDPRIAVAMAGVARAMTAVITAGELEDRLRALEEKTGIAQTVNQPGG